MSTPEPLACPRCAKRHTLDERFCADCGMPLVYVGRDEEEPLTDAQQRARKIKPQYARGELTRAGTARNLSEAELVQGILLEEGIPSLLKRTGGFDVPDFLAAGPRDVLVPASAVEAAREMLAGPEGETPPPLADGTDTTIRMLAFFLVAVLAAALIVWILYAIAS